MMKTFIYPFLLPHGLLCAIVFFVLHQEHLPAELLPLFRWLPYFIFTVGLFLGWRFNRTRLVYAFSLLLLADLGLLYFQAPTTEQLVFKVVALMLPLNVFIVSWFRERGMFNLRTGIWITIFLIVMVTCAWLISKQPTLIASWLDFAVFTNSQLQSISMPQPLLLTNVSILLLLAIRFLFKPAAFEASFFWTQVIFLFGFLGLRAQPISLYLAGAGLILIMGLLENSHALAYRDELTGLPGRRALNEALAKLGSSYTLAMLDIDHFKKFNDTHGHDVGDQVLKMVASKLATVSGKGKVFRYGGEEFSVIVPRRSIKDTLPYLEQLRQAVEKARFIPRGKDRPKKKPKNNLKKRSSNAKALKVTISIGAAEKNNRLPDASAVIKAADQALYRAKKAGRNQVSS